MKTNKINREKMKNSNAARCSKLLGPDVWSAMYLIIHYKYAQNPRILKYFESLGFQLPMKLQLSPMEGFQLEPMKAEGYCYTPERLEYLPFADDSKCIDHKKKIESKTEKH